MRLGPGERSPATKPEPRRRRRMSGAVRSRDESPIRVAAAVVWRDGRLLFTRRPPGGALGLMWELPGGKIENGETPQRALEREIGEELGVSAAALEVVGVHRHTYPHGLAVEISFLACTLASFEFRTGHEVHEVRWARPEDMDFEQVLEADRDFLRGLRARG